eukprot:990521_1
MAAEDMDMDDADLGDGDPDFGDDDGFQIKHVAPSALSYSSSAAPTAYPTPDVCEEYVVNQPCCGHFGFETKDDQVNIRDPLLTTCQRYVETDCCATTVPMSIPLSIPPMIL